MPEQTHPPYNVTQPRLSNRWLDINAQNGPLRRCSKYFVIPAFDIPVEIGPIVDIQASFTYQASNDFSIIGFVPSVTDYNHALYISYVETDYAGSFYRTVRYKLYDLFNIVASEYPQYVNQRIRKNFRIEVWGYNVSRIGRAESTHFTSVQTKLDTRYGKDEPLTTAEPVNLYFSAEFGDRALVFPYSINFNII